MPQDSTNSLGVRALRRGVPLALLFVALVGCGDRPPELNIVLERARDGQPDEATLEGLNALKVLVRDLSEPSPEVFPPFEIDDSQAVRLAAQVPPDQPFYVDVQGCPSTEQCGSLDVIARGCTGVMTIPEGQTDALVVVVMDDWPPPVAMNCPPAEANVND